MNAKKTILASFAPAFEIPREKKAWIVKKLTCLDTEEMQIQSFARINYEKKEKENENAEERSAGGYSGSVSLREKLKPGFSDEADVESTGQFLQKIDAGEAAAFPADRQLADCSKKGVHAFRRLLSRRRPVIFTESMAESDGAFSAVLTVTGYPMLVDDNWLLTLTDIYESIVSVDIGSVDRRIAQQAFDRSIQSAQEHQVDEKKYSIASRAHMRESMLSELLQITTATGDSLKIMKTRILLSDTDRQRLVSNITALKDYLQGRGFTASVLPGECRREYRSLSVSYTRQQREEAQSGAVRKGQILDASTLAFGNPFDFTELIDPDGVYLGRIPHDGFVLFDQFHKDTMRTSYNAAVFGRTGLGKSTLLKMLLETHAVRNRRVAGVDVSGEYETIVAALDGVYLTFGDGGNAHLNPLHVYQTGYRHIRKVAGIIESVLRRDMTYREELVLSKLLAGCYQRFGIDMHDAQFCAQAPSKRFPVLSDLLVWAGEVRESEDYDKEALAAVTDILQLMTTVYAALFDRHSTEGIGEIPVLFANMKDLKDDEELYNAVLVSVLSLFQNRCERNGDAGKRMYDEAVKSGRKAELSPSFFSLIFLDEAQRILTASKKAIDLLANIAKEDRKYFTGLVLAFHNTKELINRHSYEEKAHTMKTLFEELEYKFLFGQDDNSLGELKEIFSQTLSPEHYEQIPHLGQGDCLLNMRGLTIRFHVDPSKRQLRFFAGGR